MADYSSAPLSDLSSFSSRIQELKQIHRDSEETVSPSEADKLFHDSALQLEEKLNQILSDNFDVVSLSQEDLGNLLDRLDKDLRSVEGENERVESEVQELSMRYMQDYSVLGGELEGLSCSLNCLEAHVVGRENLQSTCNKVEANQTSLMIMELNHQIENKKNTLKALEDLDDKFIRLDALEKFDDAFSGVQVVEFEQNCIKLSLRTYIPSPDVNFSLHRREDISEPSEQNHELLIHLIDGTMEIKSVEIFPSDVCISEIVDAVKSLRTGFSQALEVENTSSLDWLVRRVQEHILLSTVRRSIVKRANKSRYSLEYVDNEDMIIAHLMSGHDLFIKVAYGWPFLNDAALGLISIKSSSNSSKDAYATADPFSEVVVKQANLLESHIRGNVTSFVDKIEEIVATTNGFC